MAGRIRILDTTLRDGEQTPGVNLTPAAKLEIARKLDDFGVDVIEAGSAMASKGELEAIRAISEDGLSAEICSIARLVEADIDAVASSGAGLVGLVVPASDLHIRQKLGMSREQVLEMLGRRIDYSRAHGLAVEVAAEDGSRSDPVFLKALFRKGEEHGMDYACASDTVGIMTPERIFRLYSFLRKSVDAPLAVHCHDDFGLAVANTLSAVRAGALEVQCTVNGLGERAGNAALEEVVAGLSVLYGKKLGVRMERVYGLSRLVERLTGVKVSSTKSIVGSNAFTHKSGIHVDGVLKNPETYEPLEPSLVGREREIALGKHSGTHAVASKLRGMGLGADEKTLKEIVRRVKEMGDMGKAVSDADLSAIARSVINATKPS